jgi:hypothetical protein
MITRAGVFIWSEFFPTAVVQNRAILQLQLELLRL